MRTLMIVLLCLFVFNVDAQARHKYTNNSQACIQTGDLMHPCAYQPNFLSGVRSINVRLKRVKEGTERRGSRLIATAPFQEAQEERPSFSFARVVEHVADRVGQVIGGRPSGCPYQYCGCSASLRIFGKIIPSLNLAANWGRFPSANPSPGMAAYRNHHVFVIESVNSDGTVVAHDGNSGRHLTRIHTVSLRGYRVVNPHG